MAEQPLAGPAPAPALVFTAREPSELLKQRYGENEEFLEVSYIPPSLAGAFAGGDKDTEGKIVFPRTRVATMALLAIPIPDEYQPILLTTPSIRTINAVFEKLHKYRRVPFKDMGQFVKEVPKMI